MHVFAPADFLPFRCDGCGQAFCREHRSQADHRCSSPTSRSRSTESDVVTSDSQGVFRCTNHRCEAREIVAYTCPFCNRNMCLSHRDASAHDCLGMKPAAGRIHVAATAVALSKASAAVGQGSARPAPNRVAAAGSGRVVSEKNAALIKKMRLMKVKSKCQADKSIAETRRFFLEIVPGPGCPGFARSATSAPTALGPAYVCVDSSQDAGKLLDSAAKMLKVPNNNSATAELAERLHLMVPGLPSGMDAEAQGSGAGAGTLGSSSSASSHAGAELTGASAPWRPLPMDKPLSQLEMDGVMENGGTLVLRKGLPS